MLQRGGRQSESCLITKTRGHRDLRNHQKYDMNVYYIEKRERKKRFPKPYFPGFKKKTHKFRMPRRCHALCIYRRYAPVYINMYMEIYTQVLLSYMVFVITRIVTLLELRSSKLAELWRQWNHAQPQGRCGDP